MKLNPFKKTITTPTTMIITGIAVALIGVMIFNKKNHKTLKTKTVTPIPESPKPEEPKPTVLTLDKINLIAEGFFKTHGGRCGAVTVYRKLIKDTDTYKVRLKFFDKNGKPIVYRDVKFENVKLSMGLIRKFNNGCGWGFIISHNR